MDEQTFRRLAPDAVAGRLDAETYQQWKAAANTAERAGFIVRVAEADARFSGEYGPVRQVEAREPAVPITKRTFWGLAVFFAALGVLAGGLAMESYMRNEAAIAQRGNNAGNDAPTDRPDDDPVALDNRHEPEPRVHRDIEVEPPGPEPEPEHQPEQESDPEPVGFALTRLTGGFVSIRGANDDSWRRLNLHETIPVGAALGKTTDGEAHFNVAGLNVVLCGGGQFEHLDGHLRFLSGRYRVRVNKRCLFTCYKADWTINRGAFVVQSRILGGDLYLLEGMCEHGLAPLLVGLDGAGRTSVLPPEQQRSLEAELLGVHRILLHWDGESPDTMPTYGKPVRPGALGDGHALLRRAGDPGIGERPAIRVFEGEGGARLRLRVKTDATHLRIEARVHLDDGYRAVDAEITVPAPGRWCVLDTSLDVLRAGRLRDEVGWLPGRPYSALLLSPGVDPDNLLQRHELTIDDLLVYVPE